LGVGLQLEVHATLMADPPNARGCIETIFSRRPSKISQRGTCEAGHEYVGSQGEREEGVLWETNVHPENLK
jgi:hypothetical protein